MKIELKEISIRELTQDYQDNDENGVFGFSGCLNIRPPYQREFVYKDKQRDEVIRTIMKGFPLNVMYWAVGENGKFELIDGQQRTISICQFSQSIFSVEFEKGKLLNFTNLTDDQQNKFLDYKLQIYQCTGTNSEKLDWFETINIAGEKLTNQELKNAIYSGSWVSAAKKYFSKPKCVVQQQFGDYLKGTAERQEFLETAISWIAAREDKTIEQYMSDHQKDESASELYQYFQEVFAWVKRIFSNHSKERVKLMKGQEWGIWYNKYKDKPFNAEELERKIIDLIDDDEVQKKSGIYHYLLSGQEKHLNLRAFSDKDKQKMYQKQNGVCPHCQQKFELSQMDADHIVPWSQGGKTILENGQMLCKPCNQTKSNK